MKNFRLKILAPGGEIFDKSVKKVFLRGEYGELCIMSGHTPFVTTLKPSECKVETKDKKPETIVISGGILSVFEDEARIIIDE